MSARQLIAPEMHVVHNQLIQMILKGGCAEPAKSVHIGKDSRAIAAWWTAALLVDATGKPIGVMTKERERKV